MTKPNPQILWTPIAGVTESYQLGKDAFYWKGNKGWWAQRPDQDAIQGPFRGAKAAREWAEEPHRKLAAEAAAEEAQKTQALAAKREEGQVKIWGTLPPEERELRPGQVWVMRHPKFPTHQVLILEVRKTTLLVLHRSDETPWKRCPSSVRTPHAMIRLYQFLKTDKLPKAKAS